MDIPTGISIIEKSFKAGQFLFIWSQKRTARYLYVELQNGVDIANRIIALFEAHGVKRTQIYHFIGEEFPDVKPTITAEKLEQLIDKRLIDFISELFGVRKEWIEGEKGPIYPALCFYKNLSGFVAFCHDIIERHPDEFCFFVVLKDARCSDDLYKSQPEIRLYFAEPMGAIGDTTIYRYHPVFGGLPWDHLPARYHLQAFFNIAERTRKLIVKGYNVPGIKLSNLSSGNLIPEYGYRIKLIWHPADYGFPDDKRVGKIPAYKWENFLEFFSERDEVGYLSENYFDEP
mgnify:CR=1 FL=1